MVCRWDSVLTHLLGIPSSVAGFKPAARTRQSDRFKATSPRHLGDPGQENGPSQKEESWKHGGNPLLV